MALVGTRIVTGQVTLTGGADQLVTQAVGDSPLAIALKAPAANAASAVYGPAGVTAATGDVLDPGDRVSLDLEDPQDIRVLGTAGDKISYVLLLAD